MAVPATGQVHPYNFAMAKSWKTRLIHSDVKVPEGYRSLASPVFRGSTTLFPDAASVNDSWDQYEVGYTYGLYGTPTTLELAGKNLRTGERLPDDHHARRTRCDFADQSGVAEDR